MVYLIDPEKLTSTGNVKPCRVLVINPLPCKEDWYHPMYGIISVETE